MGFLKLEAFEFVFCDKNLFIQYEYLMFTNKQCFVAHNGCSSYVTEVEKLLVRETAGAYKRHGKLFYLSISLTMVVNDWISRKYYPFN